MKHPKFAPFLAATCALLAACTQQHPTTPSQPFVAEGVTMNLDPPAAPDCKASTTYRAMLSWSVERNETIKTDVRIDTPDGKLFARSNDQKARAETGDWVRPGMWFLLLDRRSGELLGAVRAGPAPCP